jgi:2-keto-3-deoxy-galactonokinase
MGNIHDGQRLTRGATLTMGNTPDDAQHLNNGQHPRWATLDDGQHSRWTTLDDGQHSRWATLDDGSLSRWATLTMGST